MIYSIPAALSGTNGDAAWWGGIYGTVMSGGGGIWKGILDLAIQGAQAGKDTMASIAIASVFVYTLEVTAACQSPSILDS